MAGKPSILTIGIAGGTGSGKTSITRRLMREFGDRVCTIYHDNYYRRLDNLTLAERAAVNYDEPAAFETELLVEHLRKLKRGQTVNGPVYDFTIHNRSSRTVRLYPAPVLLVEGILIFENEALCGEMDIRVFVDTDADVRILRRLVRDVRDRGRTIDSVVNQYLTTVKPMHEKYVEPTRRRAHIIVPEGGKNEAAMELLSARIRAHLSEAGHG